jgi:hypothetical protein
VSGGAVGVTPPLLRRCDPMFQNARANAAGATRGLQPRMQAQSSTPSAQFWTQVQDVFVPLDLCYPSWNCPTKDFRAVDSCQQPESRLLYCSFMLLLPLNMHWAISCAVVIGIIRCFAGSVVSHYELCCHWQPVDRLPGQRTTILHPWTALIKRRYGTSCTQRSPKSAGSAPGAKKQQVQMMPIIRASGSLSSCRPYLLRDWKSVTLQRELPLPASLTKWLSCAACSSSRLQKRAGTDTLPLRRTCTGMQHIVHKHLKDCLLRHPLSPVQ